MLKKVLSEIDIYTGSIDCPKNFEIDRKTIKNAILRNYISSNTLSKNSKDLSYRDFKVDFLQPLQWLQDYIRDHFRSDYKRTLISKKIWGTVLQPNEQSYSRATVDPMDLKNAPDYTFIYGVDVSEKSCECVIHYDNNRRVNRTWHIPIKNNHFIIFPSTQKFFITKNTSKQVITLLIITYEYI